MEALFTGVTTVISNIMTLLATVTTGMLANEIFQVMLGILVLGIVISLIFYLVAKTKKRGR